jgi:hypothetical protein
MTPPYPAGTTTAPLEDPKSARRGTRPGTGRS